jgi:hypothetical protein
MRQPQSTQPSGEFTRVSSCNATRESLFGTVPQPKSAVITDNMHAILIPAPVICCARYKYSG